MRLNVKDKMAEKGLNRNQFAKLIQVGYPAACAIYDGETTRISFDTLDAICRVLECTPNDILISEDPTVKRLLAYAQNLKELYNIEDDTVN